MNKFYQYKLRMDGSRRVSLQNRKFLRNINYQRERFIVETGYETDESYPAIYRELPTLAPTVTTASKTQHQRSRSGANGGGWGVV